MLCGVAVGTAVSYIGELRWNLNDAKLASQLLLFLIIKMTN